MLDSIGNTELHNGAAAAASRLRLADFHRHFQCTLIGRAVQRTIQSAHRCSER